MKKIALFEKVSRERFLRDAADFPNVDLNEVYDAITMPRRATAGSAGYDLRTPFALSLAPGQSAKIPTGLRVRIAEGWMLALYPRSGLGFKYRLQLDNTVGIIDSDYYFADNEGHIFVKITNDSRTGKTVELSAGDAFAQGIFTEYGVTEDDDATAARTGGFGSTGK
ncbi:MAG: deoxyuridine 5'-triphosphate nucleotidohydrolase [Clostridia bacterium]|nr:deoxyuridine 5'-triphosphate nucleotidohydrolase [Clostridia bacterium]